MCIYNTKEQYRDKKKNGWHYTYLITVYHQVPDEPRKCYIGVHTSKNCLPEDSQYLGSSVPLTEFIKEHTEAKVTKTILACFLTRDDAGDHEIELHNEFDVARNPEFFNLAKHISTGFCRTGTIHSEETRRKMSIVKKGNSHSEEHKQKISGSLKGKKRKPRSEEHKQKLSESLKGRIHSEESNKKRSESGKGRPAHNKGKSPSEETRRKLSESMRGRIQSEETRRKRSESGKGKPKLKFVCRICDRKEYRAGDVTRHGLEKLGLA